MRRVCVHEGCTTVLARGNPGPYCFAHEPEPEMSYCGIRFYICKRCNDLKELRYDYRRPAVEDCICTECRRELRKERRELQRI